MQPQEQLFLLRLAADTIRATVQARPLPSLPTEPWTGPTQGGAFVTLHTQGRLRGCIGTFHADEWLPLVIREMGTAVLEDPRFEDDRVSPDELPDIDLEISVVSPLEKTDAPLNMQIGVHGIHIRHHGRTACFLPQVATEANWDARTMLNELCEMKLGAPTTTWQHPDAEICLFTTETFSDRLANLPPHAPSTQ